MTNFDLTPLLRSTVGFDRMTRLLENSMGTGEANYPPYNILKEDENHYEIAIAVAGFGEEDLEITAKDNKLIVKSLPQDEKLDGEKTYLHRGIASRNFERHFQLADYIRVDSARMEKGMLYIDLVRELPERMKPRTIEIENAAGSKKLLGKKKKAA
tara:strand:- start:894 stop:1361 length:468 start_codon:yes stop_codon:yes gene_type:complete